MILVAHRRNTIDALKSTPSEQGVEIDIRSHGSDLILHHDPFMTGVRFDEWLDYYRHRLLILNVKEEGLEDAVLKRMAAREIEDFFFLDQSFPFMMRTVNSGEPRVAVRYSEYESIDTVLALAGKARWVWVDCFSRVPLDRNIADRLSTAGFKICLVSPELHGRNGQAEIPEIRMAFARESIKADAVCTKLPALWC